MKFMKKLWKDLLMCDKMIRIYKNNHFFGSGTMNYNFKNKNIGEGISLSTITADGFKTACASVSFSIPLSEKASLYALVPNVLTRSTANYPDVTSVERKLALLYGADVAVDVSKSGEFQVLKISISCIDDRFAIDGESITDECCKLLFEFVFNPRLENGVFAQDDVESEKRLLCERLSAEASDKRVYSKNRCEEIMFGDEVYGINRFGTAEAINAITPESLFEAYKELLSQAKIAVCVSGGEFPNAEKMLRSYTADIIRDVAEGETVFVESAEDVQYVKEQEAVKQGKLVMGFRMGMKDADDNYAARRVMCDLFGGSPHSKLFTVVREKMSLCYYCSSRMFRQKGVMFVQSGIESYNEEKARDAILAQLEDIKNGNFTQDNIDSSVKALEDSLNSVSDTPELLEAWFMNQVVTDDFLYPDYYIEKFKSVKKEDIIKAAKDVTLDTVFMLEGTEGGEQE